MAKSLTTVWGIDYLKKANVFYLQNAGMGYNKRTMIKVSVISFICLLIVSLSGCATNTYVLKRINQIDQDYQSGKITYKERQIKLTELQDELETRQRWANACKGIGDVFLEKSRSTKSEKETYYIYDDPYSATPVGKIEKK